MIFKATPESALAFTKVSVYLVCSWPPNSTAKPLTILRFRVYWWIVLFLLVQLFLPLLNGIWVFRNDPIIVIKVILLSSATAQALIKIIVCRYQQKRLQALYEELENFVKNAKPSESIVLQRYVDRSKVFYGLVGVCIYLACLSFVVEPLILSYQFPTDASYPFPVKFHPVHEILYVLQNVAICHVGCALFIDTQVAILLWFIGARFEMLGNEFERVSSLHELNNCIEKHQKLLSYSHEAQSVTRFIALATITTTTIGILCGGLTLISHQPISVKFRVGNVVMNAAVELFVYAWPADNLIEMSQNIGNRAYHSSWLGKSSMMTKNMISILHRCQKPVTVSIGGFVPALSLNYYISFLSSSLSYFTTLRIIYSTIPEDD